MKAKNSTKASSLEPGHVAILLDDEEIILKPSHRIMTQVSRQYGGLLEARSKLAAENIDAMAFVIRVGSGMNDRDARDLGERIYSSRITGQLVVPLINYVLILGNGGHPLDDDGESRSNHAEPAGSDTDDDRVGM